MSGGYINPQDARAHQVVMFTFVGAIPSDKADAWNDAIRDLKQSFGTNITGVTMTGNQSPAATALDKAQARVAAKARRAKPARAAKPRRARKRRR